ncbi:MAG: V-type ATP synthase subunit D [Firmicutes bacterium]|jgi:V/A-type H+-transporting ATPase subunit D|nr:V-type ATP synthase subunit D [Bacillota bacterium]HOB21463.1 V-type ATP synthase subunit D [Bacillota bacterium]HQD38943.1 V-type ATP synthase subunit D [Bacillota bacterium]
MEIRANPNRMELQRLKRSLAMAQRGHKLLKDKRDELMRHFMALVHKNQELREELEAELTSAMGRFMLARAVMSTSQLEAALSLPKQQVELVVGEERLLNIKVPTLSWEVSGIESSNPLPYGFAQTSAELDEATAVLTKTLTKLLELATVERRVQILAQEIEKTRRRVNALEHVLIPQLEETVHFITMRLDENERANLTRLLKIKEMVESKTQ